MSNKDKELYRLFMVTFQENVSYVAVALIQNVSNQVKLGFRGWMPFLPPNQQQLKAHEQSRSLTELSRGSHTRDNYAPASSPPIRHQPRCRGDRRGDEHAGRHGVRTRGRSVCTGRWSGARGAPCECAADGSTGTTYRIPCTCAVSPDASETCEACIHTAPIAQSACKMFIFMTTPICAKPKTAR